MDDQQERSTAPAHLNRRKFARRVLIGAPVAGVAMLATRTTLAQETEPSSLGAEEKDFQEDIQTLPDSEEPSEKDLVGTGVSFNFYWGLKRGFWRLTLNTRTARASSRVFVSISEGIPLNRFVGSSRYLLYNVSPRTGQIIIRVHIDWPSVLPITASYLVIN